MNESNKNDNLTQSEDSVGEQGLLNNDFLEEEQIREIVISSDKIADITMLLYIASGLVTVLFILLFFFFFPIKIKKKVPKKNSIVNLGEKREFEALLKTIKSKESSTETLQEVLGLIIRDYGKIDEFHRYLDILYMIPIHPNANKEMIVGFDKKLSELNPKFKDKIGKAVANALKGRAKHLAL